MYKKLTKDHLKRGLFAKLKIKRCLGETLFASPLCYYKRLGWFRQRTRPIFKIHWVQNLCHITGRSRGLVFALKQSRHVARLNIHQGKIYGYKKLSW